MAGKIVRPSAVGPLLSIVEGHARREPEIWARLRAHAAMVRTRYLGKTRRRNVGTLEYWLPCRNKPVKLAATSIEKSPIKKPKPRSAGGLFEPTVDARLAGWRTSVMDTDAEYKMLSRLGKLLRRVGWRVTTGTVYLFTEYQPCTSCDGVIEQFRAMFPRVTVIVDYDKVFPPTNA